MKIIDLLNKIANGEEVPEKFRFAEQVFERKGSYIEDEDGDSIFDSICIDFSNINEEIEIIEEKKIPEKIELIENGDFVEIPNNRDLMNKINEIIDYLESKGE